MTIDLEQTVTARYSEGALERQEALCCPVDYETDLLALLPLEIIERDYGCGDPSRHVRPGDIVLDLGSGGGKICYLAAQLAGPDGRVINAFIDLSEIADEATASTCCGSSLVTEIVEPGSQAKTHGCCCG